MVDETLIRLARHGHRPLGRGAWQLVQPRGAVELFPLERIVAVEHRPPRGLRGGRLQIVLRDVIPSERVLDYTSRQARGRQVEQRGLFERTGNG